MSYICRKANFISKLDLCPRCRSSQQPPLPEINTLYPPRLRVDDACVSTNSSLAINSAALKNLDDRQLTQMARRRPPPQTAAVEQADVMQQIAAARSKPRELDPGSDECSSLTRRVPSHGC